MRHRKSHIWLESQRFTTPDLSLPAHVGPRDEDTGGALFALGRFAADGDVVGDEVVAEKGLGDAGVAGTGELEEGRRLAVALGEHHLGPGHRPVSTLAVARQGQQHVCKTIDNSLLPVDALHRGQRPVEVRVEAALRGDDPGGAGLLVVERRVPPAELGGEVGKEAAVLVAFQPADLTEQRGARLARHRRQGRHDLLHGLEPLQGGEEVGDLALAVGDLLVEDGAAVRVVLPLQRGADAVDLTQEALQVRQLLQQLGRLARRSRGAHQLVHRVQPVLHGGGATQRGAEPLLQQPLAERRGAAVQALQQRPLRAARPVLEDLQVGQSHAVQHQALTRAGEDAGGSGGVLQLHVHGDVLLEVGQGEQLLVHQTPLQVGDAPPQGRQRQLTALFGTKAQSVALGGHRLENGGEKVSPRLPEVIFFRKRLQRLLSVPELGARAEPLLQRRGQRRLEDLARLRRRVPLLEEHLGGGEVRDQGAQARAVAVVGELAHVEAAHRGVHEAHAVGAAARAAPLLLRLLLHAQQELALALGGGAVQHAVGLRAAGDDAAHLPPDHAVELGGPRHALAARLHHVGRLRLLHAGHLVALLHQDGGEAAEADLGEARVRPAALHEGQAQLADAHHGVHVVQLVELAHLVEEDGVEHLGLELPPAAHAGAAPVEEVLRHVQRGAVVAVVRRAPPLGVLPPRALPPLQLLVVPDRDASADAGRRALGGVGGGEGRQARLGVAREERRRSLRGGGRHRFGLLCRTLALHGLDGALCFRLACALFITAQCRWCRRLLLFLTAGRSRSRVEFLVRSVAVGSHDDAAALGLVSLFCRSA
ncbi:hypothetical protein EYF80_039423 [Liparis tanakae]|uniref:Uncharacterized protein n=1 Tax=Liparis tanakae TaxID=230148 RepID=A0A4Z2GA47_9TELE|nr:hypothetical protein EYF80_039423 [Liparis tanakae]